jgi:DNA repair exonuclease SbcCD ATPase subunit
VKFSKMIVKNFLGIGEIELDFDYNGLVLINGVNEDSPVSDSNGSGKSSIAEALLWNLYGVTKRGLRGDDVINRGGDGSCSVQVWFDSYCIKRDRSVSNGNSLRVFQDGIEVTKGTAKGTQEFIEEIIGRGNLAFEKLFHFGQGDTMPIASMTDANLKTIFEEAFNLGFIYECFVKIKEEERKKEGELTFLKNEMSKIANEIKSVHSLLVQLKEQNERFKGACEEDIEKIKVLIAKLNQNKEGINKAVREFKEIFGYSLDHLETLKKEVQAELDAQSEKIASLNKEVANADANYRVAVSEGKAYRDHLLKLYDELKKVEEQIGSPCPSCKKKIEQQDVSGVVDATQAKINFEVTKLNDYKELLANADRQLAKSKDELTKAQDEYNKAKEGYSTTENLLVKARELQAQKGQLAIIEMQREQYQKMIQDIMEKQNPLPEQIENKHRDLSSLNTKADEMKAKEEETQGQVDLVKMLLEIFGNGGLKSYIFDSVTPRLNELTNQYLSKLDNIDIEFSTQKQLKSGELREKFDIVVNTQNGPSSFGALSGGEKQRVSLAISLAMNKLMREMSGDPLNVLFLDEVTESLDDSSSEAVYEVIKEFAGDVDNVFVISHNQSLKDIIPVGITVIKQGGKAYLG